MPAPPGQRFDRYFIQALAAIAGAPAKGLVQSIGHIADRIMHASIVGIVGIKCKRLCFGAAGRDDNIVAAAANAVLSRDACAGRSDQQSLSQIVGEPRPQSGVFF